MPTLTLQVFWGIATLAVSFSCAPYCKQSKFFWVSSATCGFSRYSSEPLVHAKGVKGWGCGICMHLPYQNCNFGNIECGIGEKTYVPMDYFGLPDWIYLIACAIVAPSGYTMIDVTVIFSSYPNLIAGSFQ